MLHHKLIGFSPNTDFQDRWIGIDLPYRLIRGDVIIVFEIMYEVERIEIDAKDGRITCRVKSFIGNSENAFRGWLK